VTALRQSLRRKLLGVVALTTLVALLVALGAMIAYDLRDYRRGWVADLTTQAELLGRTAAPALAFDDAKMAQETLALLQLRPRIQAAAIYTAHGAVFASYARPGHTAPLPTPPEGDAVRIGGATGQLYKRIVERGEILGTVYLRSDYALTERVIGYLGIGFAVAVGALLVALALSSRLQHVITRPIMTIASIARNVVEQGDYKRRAERLSDDEVGVLVDAFNAMLDEIERRTGALEVSNRELAREVVQRAEAEHEIERLNTSLEDRVRERTAQLQIANQELEKFCYSVSHDLRAPLRSIDGFSQALLEDFPDRVPETARRNLARIRGSTLRMGQLIEDLLNLSRVSRGALSRRAVDLSELARLVVADFESREPARRVDVVIREGMGVDADPRLLRAALENLIGNAWKFTSKTPAPRIEIGSMRDGTRLVYFVRDNGAGFDMAFADKLFTAFQRLHSADEFSGTGVGLATVQRIVQRHGGRIWADAQVGSGAAFYFTLGGDDEAPLAEMPRRAMND
jgi:signal transduction histidine kinase